MPQLPESTLIDVYYVELIDKSSTPDSLYLFGEPHDQSIIEETAFSLDIGSMTTTEGGQQHGMLHATNSTITSSATGASWTTIPSDPRIDHSPTEEGVKTEEGISHAHTMQKRRSTEKMDKETEVQNEEQMRQRSSRSTEDIIEEMKHHETGEIPAAALNSRKKEQHRRRSLKFAEVTSDEMEHHDTWEIPVEAPMSKKQEQRRRRSSKSKDDAADEMEAKSNPSADATSSAQREGRRRSSKSNEHATDNTEAQGNQPKSTPISDEVEMNQAMEPALCESDSVERPQTPTESNSVPSSPIQTQPNSITSVNDLANAETPKISTRSNRRFGSKSPRPFGGLQNLPLTSPKLTTRRVPASLRPSPCLPRPRATPNTSKKQSVMSSKASSLLREMHKDDEKILMTPLKTSSPPKPTSSRSMSSNASRPGLPPFASDTEEDINVDTLSGDGLDTISGDGPLHFQDISNPQFRRLCNKLRKKINLDPWDEFKRFDNEEFTDFVQTYPQTCRVRYNFDNFTGKLFPFSIVCTMGANEETVRATWEAFPPALLECDDWIGTPLHYACSYQAKKGVVKFLIQKDSSMLEQTNLFGRTPLHMACLFKAPVQTITPLIELFPHAVEILDKDGYSPLHLACENGSSLEVIESLLEVSPPTNGIVGTNEKDLTPLHIACSNSASKAIIKALIDHCPEAADHFDHDGQLPLHHAVQACVTNGIIELLVSAFPRSIEIKNDRGQTAFRIAKRKHMPRCILDLLDGSND